MSKSWPPIVAWANWFQFAHGQRIVQQRRESRMLLWCRQGTGTLKSIGPTVSLFPGRWLLLPWGTPMVYQANGKSPFLLAGVHWIPLSDPRVPFTFAVAHYDRDAVAGILSRRDAPIATWRDQVLCGEISRGSALIHLGEYIITRFNGPHRTVAGMQTLAQLLIEEVRNTVVRSIGVEFSPRLERARQFAMLHLGEPLDTGTLAQAAECSRATLTRLFRSELRTSPAAWIANTRIEQARDLLRSTALPVHEIGARVGIEDPFYFSRLFRRHSGVSPRQYRGTTHP